MNPWIDKSDLITLVGKSKVVDGAVPLMDALKHEPDLLVPVAEPSIAPLDLATYHVRLARWEAGIGPTIHGFREFVTFLEGLDEPASAIRIRSDPTTYIVLLSADRQRLLASMAIDGLSEPTDGMGPAC